MYLLKLKYFGIIQTSFQWFPLKPVASYMAFYFLILIGYFFVSYIFYIENFNMIKIKLNLWNVLSFFAMSFSGIETFHFLVYIWELFKATLFIGWFFCWIWFPNLNLTTVFLCLERTPFPPLVSIYRTQGDSVKHSWQQSLFKRQNTAYHRSRIC